MLRANPFGLCQRFGLLLPQGGSLLVQGGLIQLSSLQEWVAALNGLQEMDQKSFPLSLGQYQTTLGTKLSFSI